MTAIPDRIFRKPEVLSDDSQILGIPANDWNRVLLGDMEKELQVVAAAQALASDSGATNSAENLP